MRKSFTIALLAACLSTAACQKMDRAAEQDLSATAPEATLPPSVPTDDTAWSPEASTTIPETVDTTTMQPGATTTQQSTTTGAASAATETTAATTGT